MPDLECLDSPTAPALTMQCADLQPVEGCVYFAPPYDTRAECSLEEPLVDKCEALFGTGGCPDFDEFEHRVSGLPGLREGQTCEAPDGRSLHTYVWSEQIPGAACGDEPAPFYEFTALFGEADALVAIRQTVVGYCAQPAWCCDGWVAVAVNWGEPIPLASDCVR